MNRTVTGLAILYIFTLVAFGWLYFFTPPREVVREIIRDATPEPVERILQPVEKMVQDTLRPLTPPASGSPAFWESLPKIPSQPGVLQNIGPVRLSVTLNQAASEVLPPASTQQSIESILKSRSIPTATDAKSTLHVHIEGQRNQNQQLAAYRVTVRLTESAALLRPSGPVLGEAAVWHNDLDALAEMPVTSDFLLQETLRATQSFTDSYLQANLKPAPISTP